MNQNKLKHIVANWRLNWRTKPFVTYGFLIIITVIYLLMTIDGGSQNPLTLVKYGAKFNMAIISGEWWRLITPAFLHIGTTHLVMNALVIYFLGMQIEKIIGHFRYFLLLLLSTLLGNVTSFAFSYAISAGASTAIFGLFASTLVLAKLYPYQKGIQDLSRNYIVLILLNVVFGLFSGTVDNAGHIGGLVGGYLTMYAVSTVNASNNPKKKRLMFGALYLLVLIVFLVIGYLRNSNYFFF